MQSEVITAVEGGATVLASSQRLARVLTEEYAAQQRLRGRSVWPTPSILPWGGWLSRCWREWMLYGDGRYPVLLNPTQELALWEGVIRESPESNGLLQIPATARSAMDAWELLHHYRLPLREGLFEASEDTHAFYGWSAEFVRRRDANGWLEEARLPDVLIDLPAPHRVLLAGFDELTPQQQMLLDRLPDVEAIPAIQFNSTPVRVALQDAISEIRQAAKWARERFERNPEARIGVIVPNLGRCRSAVERIFSEVLGYRLSYFVGYTAERRSGCACSAFYSRNWIGRAYVCSGGVFAAVSVSCGGGEGAVGSGFGGCAVAANRELPRGAGDSSGVVWGFTAEAGEEQGWSHVARADASGCGLAG